MREGDVLDAREGRDFKFGGVAESGLRYNASMFSPEIMSQIHKAAMEVRAATGKCGSEAEIAAGSYFGVNEFTGLPVRLDVSLHPEQLQIRYRDETGRLHVAKNLDVGDELKAVECARAAKLIGPQSVDEILVEYERQKALDDELIADSRRQFEAGEITEEEVYEGDFLLQAGDYRLVYEAPLRDTKVCFLMPFPIELLKEQGDKMMSFADERARHGIQAEALKYIQGLK